MVSGVDIDDKGHPWRLGAGASLFIDDGGIGFGGPGCRPNRTSASILRGSLFPSLSIQFQVSTICTRCSYLHTAVLMLRPGGFAGRLSTLFEKSTGT